MQSACDLEFGLAQKVYADRDITSDDIYEDGDAEILVRKGTSGIIVGIDLEDEADPNIYRVAWDGIEQTWFVTEEVLTDHLPGLPEGTWVRATDRASAVFGSVPVGTWGKIILNDYSDVPYKVEFVSGKTLWCHAGMVEEARLTVGDWVVTNVGVDDYPAGSAGKIIADDKTSVPYLVQLHNTVPDDDGERWYGAEDVTPAAAPPPHPIGTKVVATRNITPRMLITGETSDKIEVRAGEEGVIVDYRQRERMPYKVEFENDWWWVEPEWIRLDNDTLTQAEFDAFEEAARKLLPAITRKTSRNGAYLRLFDDLSGSVRADNGTPIFSFPAKNGLKVLFDWLKS